MAVMAFPSSLHEYSDNFTLVAYWTILAIHNDVSICTPVVSIIPPAKQVTGKIFYSNIRQSFAEWILC